MSIFVNATSAIAGLAKAHGIMVLALDDALKEEADGIIELAQLLLAPSGEGSVSLEVAEEAFVVRPAEVGGIEGSDADIEQLSGPASKIGSKVATTAWAAGFNHRAAHAIHQRGRTKGYLSRALEIRKHGMDGRISQKINDRMSKAFRRVA